MPPQLLQILLATFIASVVADGEGSFDIVCTLLTMFSGAGVSIAFANPIIVLIVVLKILSTGDSAPVSYLYDNETRTGIFKFRLDSL